MGGGSVHAARLMCRNLTQTYALRRKVTQSCWLRSLQSSACVGTNNPVTHRGRLITLPSYLCMMSECYVTRLQNMALHGVLGFCFFLGVPPAHLSPPLPCAESCTTTVVPHPAILALRIRSPKSCFQRLRAIRNPRKPGCKILAFVVCCQSQQNNRKGSFPLVAP